MWCRGWKNIWLRGLKHIPMNSDYAEKLLRQTTETYNDIAWSFSQTRNYVPSQTESLLSRHVKSGDKVLDIGCGNGRFCGLLENIGANYTGIDSSKGLIEIARDQCGEARFEVADATDLPFPAQTFDAAVAIAVLHHIPSKELRIRFFYEAHRVLKAGGIFIATAWDLRPQHLMAAGEWKRLRFYIKEQAAIAIGKSKLDFGDFFIPWQNKHQRYVRALTASELQGLAVSVGFTIIDSGILKAGNSKEQNLYIVAKKQ